MEPQAVPAQPKPIALEQDHANEAGLEAWQRLLLPFMMGSLTVMGLLFFVLTLWNFREMQGRLEYRSVNVGAILKELQQDPAAKDAAYRDWYVRAVLEDIAMANRYRQNAIVVSTRVWTRYMGFLTGMILVLTGCVFILGKLRERVDFSAEGQGFKGALVTSSPGLALALAGATLIGIALYVPTSVESKDSPVYLPQQVEVVGGGQDAPVPKPAPAAVAPSAPPGAPTGESAPPKMPSHLMQKMRDEAGRSSPAPSGGR